MPSAAAAMALLEPAVHPRLDGVARLVGIEQEFEVWEGDHRIDFRELIHTLSFDGLRLDPGDVNAYRMGNGLVVTCDEAEAETACPPISVEPGFALVGQRWAASGRRLLEAALPPGHSLRGYSTHISVSLPGLPDAPFAEAYARSFGVTFARIIDRRDSLGVYVRPRPDRIELCGEFVEGDRLGALLVFAAGTVKAMAMGSRFAESVIDLLPGVERFGYRVQRSAAGFDAYAAGRSAELSLADGSNRSLQSLLAESLAGARLGLGDTACSADTAHLAAIVDGRSPLGVEVEGVEVTPSLQEPPASPFGLATNHWQAAEALVEPVQATWAYSVFRVASRGREAFAVVPGHELSAFAGALDSDTVAETERLLSSADGELDNPQQTRTPGVFTSLPPDPLALLQPELPVVGGKTPVTGAGRFGKTGGRPGKLTGRPWKFVPAPLPPAEFAPTAEPGPHENPPPRPPLPPPNPTPESPSPVAPPPPSGSGPSKGVIAAVGGAIVAVVVVVGAWAASQGGGEQTPTPSATPTVTIAAIETLRPSETPRPAETLRPTATPTPEATQEPLPSPTVAGAAASPTAAATPLATAQPTETIASPFTPTSTSTATPTLRPTETPRPTATSTPTPSPTPTVHFEPVPTNPPPAGCTPVPGTVC